MLTIFINAKSALDEVFLLMIRPEYKQQEMVFSSNMIDAFCKEHQYKNYQFAHTPKGDAYRRIIMDGYTLEYIVMKNPMTQNYNCCVSQISKSGQLVYRRPDTPIRTIHVLWILTNEA